MPSNFATILNLGPNVAVAVTAGIAASAVVIAVIFASVYFHRRKRKQRQPKKSPEGNYYPSINIRYF